MASVISVEQVGQVFYYRPMVRSFKVKLENVVGLVCSVCFHVALLVVSGMVLIKPVEFAVDQGLSGMELQLVAGVDEPITQPVPVPVPDPVERIEPLPQESIQAPENIIPMTEEVKRPEPLAVQEQKIIPMEKPKPLLVQKIVPPEPVQPVVKGNSTVDATSTGSGALMEVKPFYLSNPAPKYPFEAKRAGWQGTVLLKVSIDKDGSPFELRLEKSSGFKVLDDAALKTVKTWKFRPAYIGEMPIDSSARVPVRFELKD